GFDMYLRMLDETVHRLVQGDGAAKLVPADVSVDSPNYLPDDFVPAHEAKLDVYRRLSRIEDPRDLEALRAELRDRFGPLPRPAVAQPRRLTLRPPPGHSRSIVPTSPTSFFGVFLHMRARSSFALVATASLIFALGACDGLKEALTAHVDVAAKAANQELSVT